MREKILFKKIILAVLLMPFNLHAITPEAGSGKFIVSYEATKNERLIYWYEFFKNEKVLQGMLDPFHANIILPKNVPVKARECGEGQAYYDTHKKEIIVCYELFADFTEIFRDMFVDLSKFEERQKWMGYCFSSLYFTLYHEVGHALIDILALPVTGKEEDAVDQLAAVILILESDLIAPKAITLFSLLAEKFETKQKDSGSLPYWDEHSFDAQRMFNIACLLFGSNPDKYRNLVGKNGIPDVRAKKCPQEYRQISSSWLKLLSPHIKNKAYKPAD